MRKSIFWIGLLVVLLVLSSLACSLGGEDPTETPVPPTDTPEPTPTEEPTATPEPTEEPTVEPDDSAVSGDMVFVESEIHGVRLCHPEGWFYEDTFFIVLSSNADLDLFASDDFAMEEGVAMIVLAASSEEMGIADSPEALFEELSSEFASKDAEIVSGPDLTTINGVPVTTIEFRAPDEKDRLLHGKIGMFDNGAQAAALIALSMEDQWDIYADTVDEIFDCIELYEGTGLDFDFGGGASEGLDMGEIAIGESITGLLSEEENHSWTLVVEAGVAVNITITPLDDGMDMAFTILDPFGTTVDFYDNAGSDEAETVEVVLDTAGAYTIVIEEFWDEAGSYILDVQFGDGGGVGPGGEDVEGRVGMGGIAIGDLVTGLLEAEQDHAWTLRAKAGDIINIIVTPLDDDMDLAVTINDSDNWMLDYFDDAFSDEPEEIMGVVLESAGVYTIIVEEFWDKVGSYTLEIQVGEEGSGDGIGDGDLVAMGEIAYGEVWTAELLADQQIYHLWTFEGAAGDVVSFYVNPLTADVDLMLGLLGPDEKVLFELQDLGGADDGEEISSYELPVSGSFSIVVTEYWDAYAEYELSLELE